MNRAAQLEMHDRGLRRAILEVCVVEQRDLGSHSSWLGLGIEWLSLCIMDL